MRTAKKRPEMCLRGPCGQLKNVQKCVCEGRADSSFFFLRAVHRAEQPAAVAAAASGFYVRTYDYHYDYDYDYDTTTTTT